MEGLHHDTNLEPATAIPDTKPEINEDSITDAQESDVIPAVKAEDFASLPVNQDLSDRDKIYLYDQIVRIRRFEERSLRAYQQGKIGGFHHLYMGH